MMKLRWLAFSLALLTGAACLVSAPAPTPNPHSPEDAINSLRELTGLPDLPIQFVGMVTMANSPGGDLQVASYKDSDGRLYSVDVKTDQVIEVDGRAAMPTEATGGAILSDPEMKTRAEKIARAVTPNFDQVSKGLEFTSGNKGGGLSFFDWRSKDKGTWMMPPFIQVALSADGMMVGYVNTVILPE